MKTRIIATLAVVATATAATGLHATADGGPPGDAGPPGGGGGPGGLAADCPFGGVKYDNLHGQFFTIPAPPPGWEWSTLILKAGPEKISYPAPVVVGQSYYSNALNPAGTAFHDISFAIICLQPPQVPQLLPPPPTSTIPPTR